MNVQCISKTKCCHLKIFLFFFILYLWDPSKNLRNTSSQLMLYYSEPMLDEDDLQLDAELHFSTMTAYITEEYSTKELSKCILIVSNYRKNFCKSEELLFAHCFFCMKNQSQYYTTCLPNINTYLWVWVWKSWNMKAHRVT